MFWYAKRIEGADSASFELVGDRFYRDRNRVFLISTVVDGADPKSFKLLGGPYARDATSIYCGVQRMVVAHPERFEVLLFDSTPSEYGWARDGEFYYWGPERVEGADYASFKRITVQSATDKNRKYKFLTRRNGEVAWWPRD